jgi:purine-binding chemotaxis protein CheW
MDMRDAVSPWPAPAARNGATYHRKSADRGIQAGPTVAEYPKDQCEPRPSHVKRNRRRTMSATTEHESVALAAASPREVLTLRLGAEEYGIDILKVQEIRSFEQPTRIANAPPHILGVTNLRGVIVPIVDLRASFGLATGFDAGTVTIVLNVASRTVGAVVDAVSDVLALAAGQIRPAPEFNSSIASKHITGIATLGEGERARMLILLDIEQLIAVPDMGLVEASMHQSM